jgi:hypothetical protein
MHADGQFLRGPWHANYLEKVLSEGKIGDLRDIS